MLNRFKKPYVAIPVWWLFWSIVGTWMIYHFQPDLKLAAVDAAVTQADWTLAAFVLNAMLKYYRPSIKNAFNLMVFSLVLAVIFNLFFIPWVMPNIITAAGGGQDYLYFLDQSLYVRFVISWMQLLFAAGLTWMWYLIDEQQAQEKVRESTEKLARDAELAQLRQQLQPHFLFNSLNSINALVGSKPDEARKMIQQLSDFLRGTVRKTDRQMGTLDEEVQQLSLYLEIERVRFGYRLRSEVDVPEETRSAQIPTLLLQPIVENAIKFGLYDTVGEITITIKSELKDGHLIVQVSNPFDPATSAPRAGTGFGLDSIRRRLYLVYFNNNLLETNASGEIFTTTIKIPQA